jgi:hypothetical protein
VADPDRRRSAAESGWPTARSWLSVLEASYVMFRLPRWHQGVRVLPWSAIQGMEW